MYNSLNTALPIYSYAVISWGWIGELIGTVEVVNSF